MKAILYLFFLLGGTNLIAQTSFEEVSITSGVEHLFVSFNMMGGGVAWFDFNNDGFEDLVAAGGARPDRLFKNNGNGTFIDITTFSGLSNQGVFKTLGVVTGDINNDGYREIFITTERQDPNILYLNNGDGTFSDISATAGFTSKMWSMGAAMGDFNLDGLLDIYVINYIENSSSVANEEDVTIGFDHDCYPNELYLNNGDNTFTEIGSLSKTDDLGCGLAVTTTDFDEDGKPDIYVANDFGEWVLPNAMLRNDHPENGFTNASVASGLDAAIYGMGIAVGDYDRDGLLDYYVTNLGRNVLFHNEGGGHFLDLTDQAEVANTSVDTLLATSWGTAFFDCDNDGFEDLFVANGYVPTAPFITAAEEDPNKLFWNLGNGTFKDISSTSGIDNGEVGRGMAVADYDNDGDMDIALSKLELLRDSEGNMFLYKNKLSDGSHWLKVKLEGVKMNRDAFGSKIKLLKDGNVWIHEINGGSSHLSQNTSIAHFGLGQHTSLDSLQVIWPGGKRQSYSNLEADKTYFVLEDNPQLFILGCMNDQASNFDSEATFNSGCYLPLGGCLDPEANNFDLSATYANGSCSYVEVITGVYNSTNPDFRIVPNPIESEAAIWLDDQRRASFRLYNLLGVLVMDLNLDQDSPIRFTRENLPPGIYLYEITTNNRDLYTGKLVLK